MTIALVTGGNRGIGYGIVRRLANEYPSSAVGASGSPLTILLGSRTLDNGQKARDSILSELASSAAKVTITPLQLDISDPESIKRASAEIQSRYADQGGIDVLINNAGIALDGFDADVIRNTMATNYHATKHVIKSIPVRDGGRIVNVASMAGILRGYGPEVTQRFLDAKTEADVDAIVADYEADVRNGHCQDKGWKSAAYSTSKCALIAYTRILDADYKKAGKNVAVNACCPGYVNTDMTKGRGVKSIDEGAATPVHLALQDLKGVTGEFWENSSVSKWHQQ
ncbi:uncharacterized protein PFL1_02949 [Pseudozyma flocculosa PF-1]|uniref:Related to carbonyl reductase n=2 Tax=Pseudozyma flocculosa TaxID=84751 RepID=A0A5C3F3Q2_9BASI|nr:uncharacterized protein PFL1_02949 [Pseudozyma flocculosa PF-1]EPQ29729.1 hypothetical protein PFL1_02949 [Pseudozyma flocculosa PF-1]SPO38307.1 related to carbonyl reductase [Pseudozyma flocculosa]